MQFDKKLTIVVPAYNEGEIIYHNILELDNTVHFFASDYEIIVVDDGSIDNTGSESVRAANDRPYVKVIICDKNNGKGEALRIGTLTADEDGYIAFVDADLDLHPRQLESFYAIMKEKNADIVIGSKLHKDSRVDYPLSRKIISWGYYIFLRLLFNLKVHDTQTGLKLFKAEIVKPVMKRILVKRFAYDIEVLSICNSRGHVITEAPVDVVFSRGWKYSRIGIKDIRDVFIDTLAIFYRLNILKYYDRRVD